MSDKRHISLLDLQRLIKERLDSGFALPVWVVCEINEMKQNYSGHCYLELVEKGGDNGVPRAKANAVIWRTTYATLSSYFNSATGSPLQVGMKVLLKVSVTFHELYGLSLQVSDIDPMYTLGDMERERQLTIERLQKEGVYDMNREQEMPQVVQRLAVISSRNAAGFQDFYNQLQASPYQFEVSLFDAFMQGAGAEESIIEALGAIAESAENFDVVVVIRGGGSQSDLSCFNSYRLCSHLAQFPLPVLTGIGHDKDQSVADLVAALALKTPTAVAVHLIDSLAQFEGYLETLHDDIVACAVDIIESQQRRVEQQAHMLSRITDSLTRSLELRLNELRSRLTHSAERLLTSKTERTQRLNSELHNRTQMLFQRESARIALAEAMVENRRPERILSLGFAIVRSNGSAVKSSEMLSPGDNITITLNSGAVEASVIDIKNGN